ncbi:dihydropteroate synthase [Halobacillus andaensis]|uniref:Dihydropteroate synthase n=1 Tax=Halobacillus andaensis TaxID=1176239 RepID=A0A917BCV0_HALAA|nr:dihydropteroate synthase [Halobacillus andaensis]MBP2006652.1 dihydropteroate synthase [Halobacillus andaensis]GGF35541.1 dihydropteroate synthase [Halobacillus andaensis]
MSFQLMTKSQSYALSEQTLVMGILNITPDSFSDGGRFNRTEAAIERAVQMEQEGAHIIDVGGESTRPGHRPVSEQEEIERVVPVIKAVKEQISIPISIDTYKAEVARQALKAGAEIVNDVWGAKREPKIAEAAAEYDAPIILMHNREEKNYNSLIIDMKRDLQESIKIAKEAGVKDHHIILDPGVGFAKTIDDNLEVMRNLDQFHDLGFPLLLGTSRKSFIGHVLDLPETDRMEGTGATVCLGISKGVQIVRVHDVKEIVRMTKMMDAMIERRS